MDIHVYHNISSTAEFIATDEVVSVSSLSSFKRHLDKKTLKCVTPVCTTIQV